MISLNVVFRSRDPWGGFQKRPWLLKKLKQQQQSFQYVIHVLILRPPMKYVMHFSLFKKFVVVSSGLPRLTQYVTRIPKFGQANDTFSARILRILFFFRNLRGQILVSIILVEMYE